MNEDRMKTRDQIKAMIERIATDADNFPGMTYEQGMEEALSWVIGWIPDDEFTLHHLESVK